MMLQAEKLANWTIPSVRQSYTANDTILYALGIGCGMNPVGEGELQYVYEEGLKAFPAMVNVLGYPGFWLKDADAGFDWRRVLHGEQVMKVFAPVPTSATVLGHTRVQGIYDKGAGRDAILVTARDIEDAASGIKLATVSSTILLRGAGGFGGPPRPPSVLTAPPGTAPEFTIELPTSTQSALIYRLSGDTNPLHVSPRVSAIAGFHRPILHGLCTLGVATRAVVGACMENDGSLLREFGARFSSPVFPGETIRTEIWPGNTGGAFRCTVLERSMVVLSNGYFIRGSI